MKTFIVSAATLFGLACGVPLEAHAATCTIHPTGYSITAKIIAETIIKSGTAVQISNHIGSREHCTLASDVTVYIVFGYRHYPAAKTAAHYTLRLINNKEITKASGAPFSLSELFPQKEALEQTALELAGLKSLDALHQKAYMVFPSFGTCRGRPGIVLRYQATNDPGHEYPTRCMVIDSGAWYGVMPH